MQTTYRGTDFGKAAAPRSALGEPTRAAAPAAASTPRAGQRAAPSPRTTPRTRADAPARRSAVQGGGVAPAPRLGGAHRPGQRLPPSAVGGDRAEETEPKGGGAASLLPARLKMARQARPRAPAPSPPPLPGCGRPQSARVPEPAPRGALSQWVIFGSASRTPSRRAERRGHAFPGAGGGQHGAAETPAAGGGSAAGRAGAPQQATALARPSGDGPGCPLPQPLGSVTTAAATGGEAALVENRSGGDGAFGYHAPGTISNASASGLNLEFFSLVPY